jgi:pimeloyl-ACP methyl ester carboxylesterase
MLARFLANSLIRPKRQPVVKNPGDYGMKYDNIEFMAPDGIRLKGWLIAGSSAKLIIVTHPMTFTKYGFSVAHQGFFKVTKLEVEFLHTIKHMNQHGYNVLAFDFRNHGESDRANNGYSAVGLFEWQDVVGALDFVSSQAALKEMPVGFLSHCMGANSTIIALSKAKAKFQKVRCLLAVQPISADVFTQCIIQVKYPLFAPFYPGINRCARKFTGYSLEEMSPREAVKNIEIPTLYAQVEQDPWTRKSDIESFYRQTPGEKKLLWLKGQERFDGYNYFGEHPEAMLQFFETYL